LRRSIDYLQTREDVDVDKLAYVGFSWGSLMGSVMIAPEDRFKAGIFLNGGICACERHPTSDPANFAPRVKIPILMINGTDDSVFPYETAQRPLFNLLGTPETHKKHVIFPGGHGISWEYHKQCNREIVKWLDQYLGPVKAFGDGGGSQPERHTAAAY
jgi:pimeloyl-ACP methyl ester carboxylesterase